MLKPKVGANAYGERTAGTNTDISARFTRFNTFDSYKKFFFKIKKKVLLSYLKFKKEFFISFFFIDCAR